MTPQEFKAWFEGFTEAFDPLPTKAQWERVKARVAEIDGRLVTERVYLDRYWAPYVSVYPRYPHPYWARYGIGAGGTGISGGTTNYVAGNCTDLGVVNSRADFDSFGAMTALGRADAAALNS